MCRQRQQTAALRHAGGVDLHVAGQAGRQLHAGAGGLDGTPGGVALGLVVVDQAVLFDLMRVGAQRRVHVVYFNASRAEVAFQVFGHHVHVVLGVFAGRVAFAADENAHHAAALLKKIVNFQCLLGPERLVHQLLARCQVNDAGSVGGQRVPHAGDGRERRGDAAGCTPGGGQHRHAACTGCADSRQRARGDLFFIVENCPVEVQRHKADVLHTFTLLYLIYCTAKPARLQAARGCARIVLQ